MLITKYSSLCQWVLDKRMIAQASLREHAYRDGYACLAMLQRVPAIGGILPLIIS